MLVKPIIEACAADVADPDFVRTTTDRWLEFLNAAERQIVLVRPDAYAKFESIRLVAGAKQEIPAGGLRFLDAVRNMGDDGLTPGEVVTITSRDPMAAKRSWASGTGSTVIRSVSFDARFPKTFWTYPPVDASTPVYLEVGYSLIPPALEDIENDEINLDAVYYNPIRQWMLHRHYAVNTQSQVARARAGDYEKSFYQSLGIKLQMDVFVSPNQGALNG